MLKIFSQQCSILLLTFLAVISLSPSSFAVFDKPVNNNEGELAKSCADLQEIFNELTWDKDTKFQGFEAKKLYSSTAYFTGEITNTCTGGYITETSPLGTRLCSGQIHQVWWETYKYNWTVGTRTNNSESSNCRWKN